MNMKIGLLNTRNDKINQNGGIRKDGNDNAKLIADHIEKNDYTFLGTQELTYKISKRIQNFLSNYKLYGKYRLGSFLKKTIINENNAVITKCKVIDKKTYHLPFIPLNFHDFIKALKKPCIMPRIIQVVIIEDEYPICIINTHIDYYIESLQKRQLNKIYKIVEKYSKKYDTFLMGDFNLQKTDDLFISFVDRLKELNMKRVPIDTKTNASKYSEKSAIDHLFIPNDYLVKEFGTLKHHDETLEDVTDHTGLYAIVEKNK